MKQTKKLITAGRTNWKNGFYIKFKAKEKSMKLIKKIVEELGSDYFVDNQVIPKTFSNYNKWKDQWIPVYGKRLDIDIICGDKIIHMIVNKYPNLKLINEIFNKYCKWAEIKTYKRMPNKKYYKKGKK
jgi:hypothetical protein